MDIVTVCHIRKFALEEGCSRGTESRNYFIIHLTPMDGTNYYIIRLCCYGGMSILTSPLWKMKPPVLYKRCTACERVHVRDGLYTSEKV